MINKKVSVTHIIQKEEEHGDEEINNDKHLTNQYILLKQDQNSNPNLTWYITGKNTEHIHILKLNKHAL
jgi:hypothetical protein